MDIEALKYALAQEFEYPYFRLDEVNAPEFDKAGGPHDWKKYVPQTFVGHWTDLSMDARIAIYVMAEYQASNEEWD